MLYIIYKIQLDHTNQFLASMVSNDGNRRSWKVQLVPNTSKMQGYALYCQVFISDAPHLLKTFFQVFLVHEAPFNAISRP
ncbi:MAG: hypothetical protein D4Q77_02975 [Methanothrix sp.]|nr:MAG: hypothetical protein D4Q77_02975 [Methanothrix sp.]